MSRITLWPSFGCVKYALWDERAEQLISFGEVRRRVRA